ncbi:double-glycine peptidase [Thiohalobacter thiocyanaticus]|uniref:Double-glycine peptidase n=1 Tax=Thiohalobacter thiocyanaticus TaxID=585455 RepID=A0A1Z4VS30_9GAMM|nr:C39 family peptidase [Thiohalobacter thiocyanaticus]BAZ94285.1 double-glycine peptidase [Thiohalobacter thiocyanaticus]
MRLHPCPALLLALSAALVAPGSAAGQLRLHAFPGAFSLPVESQIEARWQTVVRQQYDFSCGSAAVATLLTYHYTSPAGEDQVFQEMYAAGDQAKIRAEGFSMLDMKRYLDRRGLQTDGFRMDLDKLAALGVPGIVLVNTRGYRHFVVVRGVQSGRVLLADPAAGNVAISRAEFERIWNGVVLAARGRLETARTHFNLERDWRDWPRAPIHAPTRQAGMSPLLLNLPGRLELGR